MFRVFDSGKPADAFHCNVHQSWTNSKFDTFEEAVIYANKWLGVFQVDPGEFVVNKKVFYADGCYMEIKRDE